jgi:phosphoribosyl-AMP cyclohydrolase / phosphoribosyl-ATP pyrophosphohydrolase
MKLDSATALDTVDFAKGDGLVPVVAQHAATGELLMLGFANREALERTLIDGVMWYFSRTRGTLWQKGATSGNVQRVLSLHTDCDADAVLARVLPAGPTCHTGAWSCFGASPTIAALDEVIGARAADPAARGYTRRLLDDANTRLKKLGEEAVELALACERGDPERVASEAADLLYHVLVACRAAGVTAADVLGRLEQRRGVSGVAAAAQGAAESADGTESGG